MFCANGTTLSIGGAVTNLLSSASSMKPGGNSGLVGTNNSSSDTINSQKLPDSSISFGSDMSNGRSTASKIFNCDQLSFRSRFKCHEIQLWTFEDRVGGMIPGAVSDQSEYVYL